MKTLNQLISEISKIKSARFVSLVYRAKGTGELARHTLLLGCNHETAYQKDLTRLLMIQPRLDGVKAIACQELIDSLKESLSKGIGNNSAYTAKEAYVPTEIKGVKYHPENGELHLLGYSIKKDVIEKGEYKTVKSSEKTIAKNELRKLGRTGKIRQFVLTSEQINSVRINGKTLEIE